MAGQINETFEQVNAFPQMATPPQNIPVAGPRGPSAYDIAVAHGYPGSEADWLDSLRGEPGEDAPPVTDSALAALVAQYLVAHPPEAGKDGKDATAVQVSTAVAAYLAANPPARGLTGPSGKVALGTTTITQQAVVALSAGIRTVTLTGVAGVLKDDDILLFPTAALPAGYALHNAVATAAGTLVVTFTAPVLAIGASFSIGCRVVALR